MVENVIPSFLANFFIIQAHLGNPIDEIYHRQPNDRFR